MQAHLHVFTNTNHHQVGQSQPHTSEAPVLQFLGKSKKRKRRSLDTNDWISLHDYKIKGNSHTQYLIRLKVDNVVWSFWTRYSMLSELHQTLDEVTKSQLPTFPVKRLFGNLNPDFISTRKAQLDIYLQVLNQSPLCRLFLEIPKSVIPKYFKTSSAIQNKKPSKRLTLIPFINLNWIVLMFLLLLLAFVNPIPISDPNQPAFLNNLENQESKPIQTKELFLLEIADYFQGTPFYNFLDLQNKDNETKRIVIATALSIVMIVVLCVIIQFVLDVAKQSNIQLSVEKKSNQSD
ncbi:unnamed protein product (macronuclear) [Paramecium tetraurelia]|uniref:PX domain-containing protein n=1 Tax=Paramecium tetraurelia TaxID=5888 RepID=A0E274_PARTE|nr:uncharacterized protein GSPATT00022563001 [Paramecium tetraurelia]CAK89391.1 unnamed protein product [Paramecium tetraurelia]|eukprot:XP_001456788.1 hypothetical protein (macronuclear) [Paramecium tetraurelia strain d4-2]